MKFLSILFSAFVVLQRARDGAALIGGEPVNRGDANFSVSLRNEFGGAGAHMCGGVLIHPQWVLTSAECFYFVGDNGWQVVTGEHDTSKEETGQQTFPVIKVVKNENVALVQLNGSATMDGFTGTLAVNNDPTCVAPNTNCTVYGWGQTREGFGEFSNLPYQATQRVWNDDTCETTAWDKMGESVHLETDLCAGGDGKVPCRGDIGAPLVCTCKGKSVVGGVVSRIDDYCWAQNPAIYTRVHTFYDFIESTIS